MGGTVCGSARVLASRIMITLITGTPGSGKTLFAVSQLLAGEYKTRRLLVSGIDSLTLPHELLDDDGVRRWPELVQSGDVVVIDEVQRLWRPRAAGAKVPDDIGKLETHRHFGVDFVLITQHPMLLDQNVRRLVGRHIHVRRIFGASAALLYEWDHASDPGRIKDATTRSFRYPRSAFSLYKSAELHTKQRMRKPLYLLAPVVAAGLIAWFGPGAYRALSGHVVSEKNAGAAPVASSASSTSSSSSRSSVAGSEPAASSARAASSQFTPGTAAVEQTAQQTAQPAGCVRTPDGHCRCYDERAVPVPVHEGMCEALEGHKSGIGPDPDFGGRPAASALYSSADEDLSQFMHRRQVR